MEWVVVILLVLNMGILGIQTLLLSSFISFLQPKDIPTPVIPQTNGKKETKDEIEEDLTVPLEQFTPDFKKDLKFIVKEDEDQTLMEEIDGKV